MLAAYRNTKDGEPNPCYDPSRPWWMPETLDTLEEGQCKYRDVPLVGSLIGGNPLNPLVGGTPANPMGALDATVSSVAGIVIVLGLLHMALQTIAARR